jgi:hypothetical protein
VAWLEPPAGSLVVLSACDTGLGRLSSGEGSLARTVDAVDARWLQLTVLNIPLQMALTLLTAVGASSGSALTRALGWIAALLETVLLIGHIVLWLTTA